MAETSKRARELAKTVRERLYRGINIGDFDGYLAHRIDEAVSGLLNALEKTLEWQPLCPPENNCTECNARRTDDALARAALADWRRG